MTIGNYLAALQTDIPWLPGWVLATLLFFAAVAVGLVLQMIVIGMLARLSGKGSPQREYVFARTKGIIRFALFILVVSFALPLIPLPAQTTDIAHNFLIAAFIMLLGWIAVAATNMMADRYLGALHVDASSDTLLRKTATQVHIFKRAADTMIIVIAAALALMNFPSVRQFGVSLFASAGVAGIVVGFAARPMLENFFAGIQLAITQPIRVDDAVIVENEYGWVEEFGSTYVVVRLWDRRRLILPLGYFLTKPFQNWTRGGGALIGSVFIFLDYTAPVERIRTKLRQIVKDSKLWDGDVVNLQVTDAKDDTIEIRMVMSAKKPSDLWDLRCDVRERLLAYIQSEMPSALPRHRNIIQSSSLAAE